MNEGEESNIFTIFKSWLEQNRMASLLLVTGVSLGLHFLSYFLGKFVYYDFQWLHYPMHSLFEISGSIFGFLVGLVLLGQIKLRVGGEFNYEIARAIIVMSLLDGVHAFFHAGKSFVWFHSLATFLGGLLFAVILLPKSIRAALPSVLFTLILLLVLILAQGLFPTYIPDMVVKGEFTFLAKGLNLVGGGLMLLSSLKLTFYFWKYRNLEELLFVIHCLFFGIAALMFQESKLWDFSWWSWHIFRFLAYGIALLFAGYSYFYFESTVMNSKELEEINSKLFAANNKLKEFTYRVSHDLKAPLTSIEGICELGKEELDDGNYDEVKDYFSLISQGIRAQKHVVTQTLSFLQSEFSDEKVQELDFVDMKKKLLETLKPMSLDYGVSILFEIEDDLKFSSFSRIIEQVVFNLASNAIKYRNEEREERYAKISFTKDRDGFLMIQVADNGRGIPAEHQDKVFDLFSRFHADVEGSGLGMSLVKNQIDKLNGDIDFISDNSGTVFRLNIPPVGS